MNINSCQNYAFKVQGLVDDIIRKLNVPSNRELIQSESTRRDNLIRDIFNGFSISLMGFSKPPECSKDIKVFLENVIQANPSWKGIDLKSYQSILDDTDALEIIKLVQIKIDEKRLFRGGGASFLQKTHHIQQTQIYQTQPQQPPPSPSHRQKIKSNIIQYFANEILYLPNRRTSRK
jgi:hypothetical protein